MEEWRDIEGYEGIYQVSNWGNIKTLDRYITDKNGVKYFRKGTLIKPYYSQCGYCRVNLHKNGGTERLLIHRIVATAFIPNPDNLPQINHKDEDKKNNCVENLEWCSRIYNLHYGVGAEKRTNSLQKLKKEFYQKDLNGKIIKKWVGLKEFERQTGMNRKSVRDCCEGRQKTYKGFKWSYA